MAMKTLCYNYVASLLFFSFQLAMLYHTLSKNTSMRPFVNQIQINFSKVWTRYVTVTKKYSKCLSFQRIFLHLRPHSAIWIDNRHFFAFGYLLFVRFGVWRVESPKFGIALQEGNAHHLHIYWFHFKIQSYSTSYMHTNFNWSL